MPDVTVTGTPITDALRALGVQGDGLSDDSSYGIWEATTNLNSNGGAETNTSGWVAANGATLTRDTSQFKFGSACFKVQCSGTQFGLMNRSIAVTSGQPYTFSVWVYREEIVDDWRIDVTTNATGNTVIPKVLGWQRVTLTVTATGTGNATWRVINYSAAAATAIYVDGVQLENQPLATPYVETNGGTASRTAARVQAPASLLDETQGWVAMRVRMPMASTSFPVQFATLFDWRIDSNNRFTAYYGLTGTPQRIALSILAAGANHEIANTAGSWAAGDVVTIIFRWTATKGGVSFNGGAFVNHAGTRASIADLSTATMFDIGSQGIGSLQSDTDYLWFACGTGTLTDADAATLHALPNDPESTYPEDLPGDATMLWQANTAYYLIPGWTDILGDRYPRLKLEFAPTTQPTDASQTWEIITDRLRDWNYSYGRNDELARFEAGTGTLILDNRDRELDPSYDAGAWFGNIKPRRLFRLTALWDETEHPVFQAHARGFPQSYPAAGYDSVVKVDLVDTFAILQAVDLVIGFTRDAELTGARIEAVLDAIGVPAADRDIDPGTVTVDAIEITSAGTSGLDHAKQVAIDSEMGQLFVAPDGRVTFHDYSRRLNPSSSHTFTDDPSADLRYQPGFEPAYDETYLWNYIRATGAAGDETAQTAENTASQDDYFILTKPVATQLVNGSEIQQVADRYALRYPQPELRAPTLPLNGARDPDVMWPVILTAEVSEMITVERFATDADPMVLEQMIEGVAHACRPGGPWTTSLVTSPADTNPYLTLNDATLGELDDVNILA